jgi:hypothetical protein
LKRVIFTVRRTAHVVAASVLVELALDFGAGALAVILAPFAGNWVYAAAGVIVVGSVPVLSLNIARVARREWRQHHFANLPPSHRASTILTPDVHPFDHADSRPMPVPSPPPGGSRRTG